MLDLPVLVERVGQLRQRLRPRADDVEAARLILRRDLPRRQRAGVSGDHRHGRFQVVGDVGDHLLPRAIEPFPLPFALLEPLGEHVEAAPDPPKLPHAGAVADGDGAPLRPRGDRLSEPVERPADRAPDPHDEKHRREYAQRRQQQPDAQGVLVGAVRLLLVGVGRLHEQDEAFPAAAFKRIPLQGGLGRKNSREKRVLALRVLRPPVAEAAGYDAVGGVEHHLLARAVRRVPSDVILRLAVRPADRVRLHMGAGAVHADAGKLALRQRAGGVVGRPDRFPLRREDGKGVPAAEQPAQGVVPPRREAFVGDEAVPVGDVVNAVDGRAPQPVNAARRRGERKREQKEGLRQQRGQAALPTLQFCIRVRGWSEYAADFSDPPQAFPAASRCAPSSSRRCSRNIPPRFPRRAAPS